MIESYTVLIYERWVKEYVVAAESEDEAIAKAQELLSCGVEPRDFDFMEYDDPWAIACRTMDI